MGSFLETPRFQPSQSKMKTPKSTKSRIYLWIDFHGHKQPEGSVWVQGVQFLFQSYQPLRRQVDILQQNPSEVKRNQMISVKSTQSRRKNGSKI